MSIDRPTRCLVLATALILLGCSDEQHRDLGEIDVRETLASHVEAVIDEQGFALDGDLDCSSHIDEDGAVTGSCSGSTANGASVAATLTGTGDVDAATCAGHLVVEVDVDTILDDPAADCFDVG